MMRSRYHVSRTFRELQLANFLAVVESGAGVRPSPHGEKRSPGGRCLVGGERDVRAAHAVRNPARGSISRVRSTGECAGGGEPRSPDRAGDRESRRAREISAPAARIFEREKSPSRLRPAKEK